MRPHVVTQKHYVQFTQATVAALANVTLDLVEGVAVVDKNVPSEVEEGSIVSAVYVDFWLTSSDTSIGTYGINLEKIPSGATSMTFTQQSNLNGYPNKKNIFFFRQAIHGDIDNNPIPVLTGWFKIPKGKQRIGLGDKIVVNISSLVNGLIFCGGSTYKEQK